MKRLIGLILGWRVHVWRGAPSLTGDDFWNYRIVDPQGFWRTHGFDEGKSRSITAAWSSITWQELFGGDTPE